MKKLFTCLVIGMGMGMGMGISVAQASQSDKAEKIQVGEKVYQQWCIACHGPGQHTPGTMALYFKYEGKIPPLLEHRVDMTEDSLKVFIRNGISVMPSFRPTEISDKDIAAVAAYLQKTSSQVREQP